MGIFGKKKAKAPPGPTVARVDTGPRSMARQRVTQDLKGADLRNADFSWTDLNGRSLKGANLAGADFTMAFLHGANLSDTNLEGANLSTAEVEHVRSGGITGSTDALPHGFTLIRGYLVGPEANLTKADLVGADLRGADLSSAEVKGANLVGADLTDARVMNVNFEEANTDETTTCPDGRPGPCGYGSAYMRKKPQSGQ